jgi:diadenosine tetraphosphatase ApaH/serine/threonine PP2A family protein phosphatase
VFILAKDNGGWTLKVRLLSGRRVVMDLEPDNRYLVNPGSVGQPRDRDPRSAYAIYDAEQRRLYVYRVNYRAALARRRIIQAGLPPVLGDRLLYGA